jgi:hypothetical protein
MHANLLPALKSAEQFRLAEAGKGSGSGGGGGGSSDGVDSATVAASNPLRGGIASAEGGITAWLQLYAQTVRELTQLFGRAIDGATEATTRDIEEWLVAEAPVLDRIPTLEAKALAVVQSAGVHCVLTDQFGAVATLLSGGTVSVDDLSDSGDLPTDTSERAHFLNMLTTEEARALMQKCAAKYGHDTSA